LPIIPFARLPNASEINSENHKNCLIHHHTGESGKYSTAFSIGKLLRCAHNRFTPKIRFHTIQTVRRPASGPTMQDSASPDRRSPARTFALPPWLFINFQTPSTRHFSPFQVEGCAAFFIRKKHAVSSMA
jgi:hypothetical protein